MSTTTLQEPQWVPLAERMTQSNVYARDSPEVWDKVLSRSGRATSNWVRTPKDQRGNFFTRFAFQGLAAPEVYMEKPNIDRGPPPRQSCWREHGFILSLGLLPVWIQGLSYWAFPNTKWPAYAAWPFYFVCFFFFILVHINRLHYYCALYGTFDEKVRGRDIPSDRTVSKLVKTTFFGFILRTSGTFILAYNKDVAPVYSLLSPIKIAWWTIMLDMAFYTYHRSAHEIPWLCIHQQHHIHTIIADDRQECLEIILIPLFASACVRLNFAEAWAAVIYLMYTESMGHSGVRAYWPTPLSPFLRHLGWDLCIEDHDLHHRYGRGGMNYGKQTRIFDKLFGTITPREETKGM